MLSGAVATGVAALLFIIILRWVCVIGTWWQMKREEQTPEAWQLICDESLKSVVVPTVAMLLIYGIVSLV